MDLKSQVYTGTDCTEAQLHPLGPGLAAVFTQRAPDSTEVNEDSCAIIPYSEDTGVLVVADGAGGLPDGAQASQITVQTIRATLRAASKKNLELRTAILDAIEKANREVQKLGLGAATTLAIAEIQGKRLRTYHVGDSQIMVIGHTGKIKLKTMSHSPVGYGVEAGFIEEQDAIMHEELHLVSNLIGFDAMHIEIGTAIDLSPKDTVIIASDGLFDNLRSEEIADSCRSSQLLAVNRKLVDACHARMTSAEDGEPSKPDDLTIITYRRSSVDSATNSDAASSAAD
ncbi:MAG: serine/threonine-protein phosphatase [Deltaproteobacteria bacterium]|nr:serine/threonine-protein phosphatase [Deltaproteobacteria bacterium]